MNFRLLKEDGPFDFPWWVGSVERYESRFLYSIEDASGTLRDGEISVAFGWRSAFGKNRRRVLVYRGERNVILEFVGADDFDESDLVLWLVRQPGSRKEVPTESELPPGFGEFRCVPFDSCITGRNTRPNIAVVLNEHDHSAMIHAALLRESQRRSSGESNVLNELLSPLTAHFNALTNRMVSFHKHGTQIEGWFKGELLTFLDSCVSSRKLAKLDREIKTPSGRIDIAIEDAGGTTSWIELKHWLIGKQKGFSYNPSSYFGDASGVGITKDVDKLREAPKGINVYMLILMTANPGSEAWNDGIEKFNSKFAPRHVESLTNPADFDSSYFLGLLEVRKSG